MAICFRLIGEFNHKLDPTNIFGSVKFGGKRRAELGDRVDKLLAECRIWEGYVGAGPYFTGGAFSIADIVVLPFFGTIIDGLGLRRADYPNLHAWYERCKSRPSVAKRSATSSWRARPARCTATAVRASAEPRNARCALV